MRSRLRLLLRVVVGHDMFVVLGNQQWRGLEREESIVCERRDARSSLVLPNERYISLLF